MCGIVGLFLKRKALEPELGRLFSPMLVAMTERGSDSAGVAVYRRPAADGTLKFSLFCAEAGIDWSELASALAAGLDCRAEIAARGRHAILCAEESAEAVRAWLGRHYPLVRLVGYGERIELFKEMGLPHDVVARFALRDMGGTHAIGHTRMATESAVTTEHSHPFATGLDLCLVHNGSLSNHNRLRAWLRRRGVAIDTDNDTEVAAGYLAYRLAQGSGLDGALEAAIADLDGFYTFAVGTKDGFAVLRDAIACKPAVLAETDDWVAMASEYRAIAGLPGAEGAAIWEPAPETVYHWSRT